MVYYRFYKGAPLVPVSNQINTFYAFSYYFLKIIFQLCLGLPSELFPHVSLTESCMHLISSPYIPHPSSAPSAMCSPKVIWCNLEAPHYTVSSFSFYFLSVRPKFLPRPPVLATTELFQLCEISRFHTVI